MEVLKDYPEEFAQIFQTSFNFLFKINMTFWFNGEGWITRYWRFLYILPIIVVFYITVTINVSQIMIEGTIYEITYRLPPFLVMIQAILKVLVIFPRTTQITNIIKDLGAVWRTEGLNDKQKKNRNTHVKRLNFCNRGTYWIAIIGSSQYLLSPLFETLFSKFVLQHDSELLLPIASSYPFNPTGNWIVYITVYAFQTYSMFLCVLAYIGTELIMITLCALLNIEFKLLCEDLLQVKPARRCNGSQNENQKDFRKIVANNTIEDIVKKHQKLILLSTQTDNVFNKLIFVDLLFVGGTTCFFKYAGQFSRGPTYMLINYFAVVSSLLYVWLLCYYGELLTTASLRVGDAAYGSLWYKENKHYQRIIVMIIKRSQSACCLTSMNYTPVTLNMFTKVMSTTWSYFSLMNSVYEEQ